MSIINYQTIHLLNIQTINNQNILYPRNFPSY